MVRLPVSMLLIEIPGNVDWERISLKVFRVWTSEPSIWLLRCVLRAKEKGCVAIIRHIKIGQFKYSKNLSWVSMSSKDWKCSGAMDTNYTGIQRTVPPWLLLGVITMFPFLTDKEERRLGPPDPRGIWKREWGKHSDSGGGNFGERILTRKTNYLEKTGWTRC